MRILAIILAACSNVVCANPASDRSCHDAISSKPSHTEIQADTTGQATSIWQEPFRKRALAISFKNPSSNQVHTKLWVTPFVSGPGHLLMYTLALNENQDDVLGVWGGELEFDGKTLRGKTISGFMYRNKIESKPEILHAFFSQYRNDVPTFPSPYDAKNRHLSPLMNQTITLIRGEDSDDGFMHIINNKLTPLTGYIELASMQADYMSPLRNIGMHEWICADTYQKLLAEEGIELNTNINYLAIRDTIAQGQSISPEMLGDLVKSSTELRANIIATMPKTWSNPLWWKNLRHLVSEVDNPPSNLIFATPSL